jgi:hypothetical protein
MNPLLTFCKCHHTASHILRLPFRITHPFSFFIIVFKIFISFVRWLSFFGGWFLDSLYKSPHFIRNLAEINKYCYFYIGFGIIRLFRILNLSKNFEKMRNYIFWSHIIWQFNSKIEIENYSNLAVPSTVLHFKCVITKTAAVKSFTSFRILHLLEEKINIESFKKIFLDYREIPHS